MPREDPREDIRMNSIKHDELASLKWRRHSLIWISAIYSLRAQYICLYGCPLPFLYVGSCLQAMTASELRRCLYSNNFCEDFEWLWSSKRILMLHVYQVPRGATLSWKCFTENILGHGFRNDSVTTVQEMQPESLKLTGDDQEASQMRHWLF